MYMLADGDALVSIREEMGLNQTQLCNLAGITCKTLRRMERSKHTEKVRMKKMRAVANVLKVHPTVLGSVVQRRPLVDVSAA
jgi:transcriptional regulator with XRE-family HTH domain